MYTFGNLSIRVHPSPTVCPVNQARAQEAFKATKEARLEMEAVSSLGHLLSDWELVLSD
jgi:hypothetical protein